MSEMYSKFYILYKVAVSCVMFFGLKVLEEFGDWSEGAEYQDWNQGHPEQQELDRSHGFFSENSQSLKRLCNFSS